MNPLTKLMIRKSRNFVPKNNLWITGRIYCDIQTKTISFWISNFSRCTIKELYINCILNINEFEILTKEGTIEQLTIKGVVNSSGTHMAVEDIVAAVPKAFRFLLGNSHVTPLTLKNLCSMNRKNKFKEFSLYEIDQILDENEYFQFTKTHADPGEGEVTFLLSFASPITKEMQKKFVINVKTKIFLWKTSNAKPCVREVQENF